MITCETGSLSSPNVRETFPYQKHLVAILKPSRSIVRTEVFLSLFSGALNRNGYCLTTFNWIRRNNYTDFRA